jgi:hypothetical protein
LGVIRIIPHFEDNFQSDEGIEGIEGIEEIVTNGEPEHVEFSTVRNSICHMTFPIFHFNIKTGDHMQQNDMNGSETTTVSKKDLYDIVKFAAYDALSNVDFITKDELQERETALKELEDGEAVSWQEYLKGRSITA